MSKSPTSSTPQAAIWLADSRAVAADTLERHIDWLGTDEAARYRRFVRPQRQQQFLLGRILLRMALGELLGIAPHSIMLSERPGRAPLVQDIRPPPFFSIAHSGPWVACAVSADMALGLDIEVRNPVRDLIALAQQAFSPEEAQQLAQLETTERVSAFYELWSRKEAAYKLASALTAEHATHFSTMAHPDISIVLCSPQAPVTIALRDSPLR